MRARLPIVHHRLDRVLIALAVFCVLTMPVEYRGGADVPHAHAVFQFWSSHISDAFDHHDHAHPTSASSDHDKPPAIAQPAPDIPLLSEMTVSAKRAMSLAVAVVAGPILLPVFLLRRPRMARVLIPAGLTLTPDAPPPRPILFRG